MLMIIKSNTHPKLLRLRRAQLLQAGYVRQQCYHRLRFVAHVHTLVALRVRVHVDEVAKAPNFVRQRARVAHRMLAALGGLCRTTRQS
eukprot:1676060-Pyramimonas_sp.AAC.1